MFNAKKINWVAVGAAFVLLVSGLSARAQEETRGLKFNNLSLSPFVNFDYTYDSNVSYDKNGAQSDSILSVHPGVDFTYKGNDWGLKGGGWFAYDRYIENDQLDAKRYGENVDFYRESASGWRFVLGESYVKSAQQDSLTEGGRGLWRDRDQFTLNTALSYQMSEKTSLTLSGMYSDLSYATDSNQYYPLYGWQEWSTGLELAHRITEKSNLLLNGQYQRYSSDGATQVGSESTGYSLMAGFGSAATKRISYHALTGVSWFDYADGDMLTGWTYSLDASWIINKKLVATIAGSSYYQPSEYEQNQAVKTYTLSTGVSYRPLRKLTTHFDVAWRREEEQYGTTTSSDGTSDLFSTRVRADYQLMRYVTLYGGLEYEKEFSDTNDSSEFDRYRGSLGMSFRY
jgi:hypothetical protein